VVAIGRVISGDVGARRNARGNFLLVKKKKKKQYAGDARRPSLKEGDA